jgi:hypothetical protein
MEPLLNLRNHLTVNKFFAFLFSFSILFFFSKRKKNLIFSCFLLFFFSEAQQFFFPFFCFKKTRMKYFEKILAVLIQILSFTLFNLKESTPHEATPKVFIVAGWLCLTNSFFISPLDDPPNIASTIVLILCATIFFKVKLIAFVVIKGKFWTSQDSVFFILILPLIAICYFLIGYHIKRFRVINSKK